MQASELHPYAYLFKFVLLGDMAVGKTCLLLQFTDGRYRPSHQITVGVEFGSKTVTFAGKIFKLQCWDTAGADRFRSFVRTYYPGSHGALLVYDVTRRSSFAKVAELLQAVRERADPDLVVTLVGNKCDQSSEREVSQAEAFDYAQRMDLHFLEASAATRHMVDEAFVSTAKLVYQKRCPADVVVVCNPSNGHVICSTLAGEHVGEFEIPPDEQPYGSWLVDQVCHTMRAPDLLMFLVGSDGQILWRGLVNPTAEDRGEPWCTCCLQ
eukprot:TRINITY_DN395_c0_g2_i1.p1 TRINITY_DN395_c0_g2~~TRINITY_DN395_c0_g2_i1.p1  ORF type:complete len:267 (-),score=34.48 TRINITY_DN395_c0_g2_i1:278-1078(-)